MLYRVQESGKYRQECSERSVSRTKKKKLLMLGPAPDAGEVEESANCFPHPGVVAPGPLLSTIRVERFTITTIITIMIIIIIIIISAWAPRAG